MEDIIKLCSRGNNSSYLKKLRKLDGGESKTYAVRTDMPILRIKYTEEKKKFINLLGGPTIVEDSLLEEANAIVKSVDFIEGYGYTITFE